MLSKNGNPARLINQLPDSVCDLCERPIEIGKPIYIIDGPRFEIGACNRAHALAQLDILTKGESSLKRGVDYPDVYEDES